MASSPAGCASIFHVLLLSFLAALARMSQIFLAELLCWFGSASAVSETASCKVQRKKGSLRVKASKAPVQAGWRRPSLARSHVFYLLAALHLCVSAVAGYSAVAFLLSTSFHFLLGSAALASNGPLFAAWLFFAALPGAALATPSSSPSQCRQFCKSKTHLWEVRCSWNGCGACSECSELPPSLTGLPPPSPSPAPVCKAHCAQDAGLGCQVHLGRLQRLLRVRRRA